MREISFFALGEKSRVHGLLINPSDLDKEGTAAPIYMSSTRIAPSKILPKGEMPCHLKILPWRKGIKLLYLRMPRRLDYGSSQPEGIDRLDVAGLPPSLLPTRKGADIRLQRSTTPDPEMATILHKLKLEPPIRLIINPQL